MNLGPYERKLHPWEKKPMSDTPRTDAVVCTPIMGDECTPHKWDTVRDLARALERENAALREDIERHLAVASTLATENAALREALEDLVSRCDGAEGVRADGSNIQTMRAHAALGELTQTGDGLK